MGLTDATFDDVGEIVREKVGDRHSTLRELVVDDELVDDARALIAVDVGGNTPLKVYASDEPLARVPEDAS